MSKKEDLEAVCKCGHTWVLRKPPEEMSDGPRCSECGERDEAISVVDEEQHRRSVDGIDSEIARAAMCERRLSALRERVEELLDSLAGTAPRETDAVVARELRGPYRELQKLKQELDRETNDNTSLAELDGVEERLNTLEGEIDEHSRELTTVDEVSDKITELEKKRHRLQEDVDRLSLEKGELQSELDRIESELDEKRPLLNRAEDRWGAWEEGYNAGLQDGREEARNEFKIHIPCASCGELMTLNPGSRMHNRVVYILRQEGWNHSVCPNQQDQPGLYGQQ